MALLAVAVLLAEDWSLMVARIALGGDEGSGLMLRWRELLQPPDAQLRWTRVRHGRGVDDGAKELLLAEHLLVAQTHERELLLLDLLL